MSAAPFVSGAIRRSVSSLLVFVWFCRPAVFLDRRDEFMNLWVYGFMNLFLSRFCVNRTFVFLGAVGVMRPKRRLKDGDRIF